MSNPPDRETRTRALLPLTTAAKTQLERIRTTRHEFETLLTTAHFVVQSARKHQLLSGVAELQSVCNMLEKHLGPLICLEDGGARDLHALKHLLDRVHCTGRHHSRPEPTTEKPALHACRAEELGETLRSTILDSPAWSERWEGWQRVWQRIGSAHLPPLARPEDLTRLPIIHLLAKLRLVHPRHAERIVLAQAGAEDGLSGSIPHQSDRVNAVLLVRSLLDELAPEGMDEAALAAATLERQRDRDIIAALQLQAALEASFEGPDRPLLAGRLLRDLALREDTFEELIGILASTRRTFNRLIDGLAAGFPPVPRARRAGRSFTYRILMSMLRSGAESVRDLHHLIRQDEDEFGPWTTETIAYTDVISSRVNLSQDALAIECPLHHVDAPRFLIDIFHECAHAPLQAGQPERDTFRPEIMALWAAFDQRLKEVLDQHTDREMLITELLSDTLAIAASGPFFTASLATTLLSRTRTWSRAAVPTTGLHRVMSALIGSCRYLGILRPDSSYPELPWRLADAAAGEEASGSEAHLPLRHLFLSLAALYRVHVHEVRWLMAHGEPAQQAAARHAAKDSLLVGPGADFVYEILTVLRTLAQAPPHTGAGRSSAEGEDRPAKEARHHWLCQATGAAGQPPDSTVRAVRRLSSHFETFSDRFFRSAVQQAYGVDLAEEIERPRATLDAAILPQVHTKDAREGDTSGIGGRLVELNAMHLVWQIWHEAHWINFRDGRHWNVAFERISDFPALLYLTLLARSAEALDSTHGGWELPKDWNRSYFGVGKGFELIGVDAHWNCTDSQLRGWLEPFEAPFAHVLGHMDAAFIQPWPALQSLDRDDNDPLQSAWVAQPFYTRTLSFEWLTAQQLRDCGSDKTYSIPDFGEYSDIIGGQHSSRSEPCFLFLQYLRVTPTEGDEGDEIVSTAPLTNYKELAKLIERLDRIEGLRICGASRAFGWAEMALWIESRAWPASTVRDAFASAHQDGPGPQTDTTTLIRWTPLLRALSRALGLVPSEVAGGSQGRTGGASHPLQALEDLGKLVGCLQPNSPVQDGAADSEQRPPPALECSLRAWQSRASGGEVNRNLQELAAKRPRIVNKLCALWGHERDWRLDLTQGFGEVDVIGQLVIPAPPQWLRSQHELMWQDQTVPGYVMGQAIAAMTILLTVRWMIEQAGAYEVLTQVSLQLPIPSDQPSSPGG